MFLAYRQREMSTAQRLAAPIARLTAVLFRESSPVPLKHALSVFGLMSPRVRLPLVGLSEQSRTELATILVQVRDDYAEHMIGDLYARGRGGCRAASG
jgi:4-hydroxy-tetrahydrodipicolinate synthase